MFHAKNSFVIPVDALTPALPHLFFDPSQVDIPGHIIKPVYQNAAGDFQAVISHKEIISHQGTPDFCPILLSTPAAILKYSLQADFGARPWLSTFSIFAACSSLSVVLRILPP